MSVRTERLRFSFRQQMIFDEVSFTIPNGSVVGLCGSSGIGKTTLARVLCGVLPVQSGAIYLNEQCLCAPGQPYDRKRGLGIQMVYQQPYAAMDPNQTVGGGLSELIRYHRFAPDRRTAQEMAQELLAQVGLGKEILPHRPQQLSGGETQRIALARCLLFRPELLILDEATSMLDVSTQANILALVRERVIESYGGSVLMISHDLPLVRRYCDRQYELSGCYLEEVL